MKTRLVWKPEGVLDPTSVRVVNGAILCEVEMAEETMRDLDESDITIGRLTVSPTRMTATLDGKQLKLRAKSMRVLIELARRPGTSFTADDLYELVWGGERLGSQTVRPSIAQLRAVLPAGAIVNYIRGGWKLDAAALEKEDRGVGR